MTDTVLGFLNISFEMILYFDQQISIRPHFIYQNILIKIRNLKLSAKTQMSSHSHPTDPDTVAHRTSAVSIAPHLELSQDAGTIRSLAPFSPQPACCSSASAPPAPGRPVKTFAARQTDFILIEIFL